MYADRVRGAGLPLERAILHGKLEEHDEALRILVLELQDFAAAEDYCMWRSEGRDPAYRRRLFHSLLSLYLSSELPVAATDLLNRHAAEFDAAQVLPLLPGAWSVQLLCPFLTGAVRDSVHGGRSAQVAVGLARSENRLYKYEKVRGTSLGTCSFSIAFSVASRVPNEYPSSPRRPRAQTSRCHLLTFLFALQMAYMGPEQPQPLTQVFPSLHHCLRALLAPW